MNSVLPPPTRSLVRYSLKVNDFEKKHLKKARGYCGHNVRSVRIKISLIVRDVHIILTTKNDTFE